MYTHTHTCIHVHARVRAKVRHRNYCIFQHIWMILGRLKPYSFEVRLSSLHRPFSLLSLSLLEDFPTLHRLSAGSDSLAVSLNRSPSPVRRNIPATNLIIPVFFRLDVVTVYPGVPPLLFLFFFFGHVCSRIFLVRHIPLVATAGRK